MRASSVFALALSVFGVTAVAVGSQSAQPACVTKCWANSQYVSNCAGNQKCLCDDAEFQNAMYQCLYSQCQTAQFGVALHHALALCSEDQVAASSSTVPALLRQGDLRKRQFVTQSASVMRTTYTRTDTRTVTATHRPMSVSASAYMTYATSRAYPTSSVGTVYTNTSMPTMTSTSAMFLNATVTVAPTPVTATSVLAKRWTWHHAASPDSDLNSRELWEEKRHQS